MCIRDSIKDMPYLLDTRGDMDVEIGAVSCNSREKTSNGLFFCIAAVSYTHLDVYKRQVVPPRIITVL